MGTYLKLNIIFSIIEFLVLIFICVLNPLKMELDPLYIGICFLLYILPIFALVSFLLMLIPKNALWLFYILLVVSPMVYSYFVFDSVCFLGLNEENPLRRYEEIIFSDIFLHLERSHHKKRLCFFLYKIA